MLFLPVCWNLKGKFVCVTGEMNWFVILFLWLSEENVGTTAEENDWKTKTVQSPTSGLTQQTI